MSTTATLPTHAINELPTAVEMSPDFKGMPCEHIFHNPADGLEDSERDQLKRAASALGCVPKIIPVSSLQQTAWKNVDFGGGVRRSILLPKFACIDPFADVRAKVIDEASRELVQEKVKHFGFSMFSVAKFFRLGLSCVGVTAVPRELEFLRRQEKLTEAASGHEAANVTHHFGNYAAPTRGYMVEQKKYNFEMVRRSVKGLLGFTKTVVERVEHEPTVEMGPESFDQTRFSRESLCAAFATSLPGRIPQDVAHQLNILDRKADNWLKTDGNKGIRLICEANWKLVQGSIQFVPERKDPLIVYEYFGKYIYIDRFDCTSAEEYLAREHVVKL